jgi:hypothetical protein
MRARLICTGSFAYRYAKNSKNPRWGRAESAKNRLVQALGEIELYNTILPNVGRNSHCRSAVVSTVGDPVCASRERRYKKENEHTTVMPTLPRHASSARR